MTRWGAMAAGLIREFGLTPEAAAAPQHDKRKPVAVGRDQVLAAFVRNRPPPPAATPQPRPTHRQAEPEPISNAAWDEICAGLFVGNLVGSRRKWGPAPGESGCRVPLGVLKRNRLARSSGPQPPSVSSCRHRLTSMAGRPTAP